MPHACAIGSCRAQIPEVCLFCDAHLCAWNASPELVRFNALYPTFPFQRVLAFWVSVRSDFVRRVTAEEQHGAEIKARAASLPGP